MAYGFPTHTGVVIEDAQSISGPIDLRGRRIVGIQFPASLEGDNVGFQVASEENGTYVNVFVSDTAGAETAWKVGAASSQYTAVDTIGNAILGNAWMRVQTFAAAVAQAQTGDATLLIYTVDLG